MKIGEVIRKYRKEKQLTQEQVAEYLGVTAPAVNKWENGNSLPDISLLAPIARLLEISTDTLLSYKEELTEQEMNQIVNEIVNRVKYEEYDTVFLWTEEKIQEYPNCVKLALMAAQLLDSYRFMLGVENPEQYDHKIEEFYLRALNSPEYELSQTAAQSLFHFSLNKKDFDRAQEYLHRIPRPGTNPKRLEALFYQVQGKNDEACRLYEQILFSGFGELNWALNGISSFALSENDLAKAENIVKKQKELAHILEMGPYMEASAGLGLAIYKKDREQALEILRDIIRSLEAGALFGRSDLYSHMAFSDSNVENLAFMLLKGFEEDETIDFLKDDERCGKLIEKLKRLTEKKDDQK